MGMICLGYDETFCLNALEANACGLPVITLGKTVLKDYVINNFNGYIVNNFSDIALKIKSKHDSGNFQIIFRQIWVIYFFTCLAGQ